MSQQTADALMSIFNLKRIDLDIRLKVANAALSTFSIAQIERRKGGFYVTWTLGDKTTSKRWMCRGQDFYPVWSHKYPGGGTSTTALAQLIRWCRNQPVLPISTWKHWASDNVKLVTQDTIDMLLDGGYPSEVKCVRCGKPPVGLDWWSLDGVSGPCCSSLNRKSNCIQND